MVQIKEYLYERKRAYKQDYKNIDIKKTQGIWPDH